MSSVFSFFRATIALLSVPLLGAAAAFLATPAHAQFSGGISVNGSGPTLNVINKGSGKADLVLKGVVGRGGDTLYCLTGTKANWAGNAAGTKFDTSRMACSKVMNGVVTLSMSVDGYQQGGLTIGLMPISVKADSGMRVMWEPYPNGSPQFKARSGMQSIIGIRVESTGFVRAATAAEAMKDIDD